MKKEKNEKHFINRPSYLGGNKALSDFIRQHTKYPKEALQAKVEGVVQVRIAINYKGDVVEGKIISSLGYGCNEEAIRVLKLLKFEVPKNRKVKVKFHKKLNVQFKLPKAKPKQATPTTQPSPILYTVKQSKPAEEKSDKKNTSYGYTIKW